MAGLSRVVHARHDDAASHVRLLLQMRMPELEMSSDVSVALIAYLTKTAEGGEISAPGLKR